MSGDNNVVSPTKANKLQDKEGSMEGQEEEEWKQMSDCQAILSMGCGAVFILGIVAFVTLIPQHNQLEEPQYWYEPCS